MAKKMTTTAAAAPTTTFFAFDPPPTPSVAIVSPVPTGAAGEGSIEQQQQQQQPRFPVHRIYCVGRNYSDHVQEMGGDPTKSIPTFFTKPADAVVESPATIAYPLATKDLHYEVELVVCIGKGGVQIPIDQALDHVYGYAVGLDLTKRDLQASAKAKGMPWDSSKAFDQSAPMGAIVPVAAAAAAAGTTTTLHDHLKNNKKTVIQLSVNGILKQHATLDQMVWSIPQIIHQLSHQFHLQPGDLIFTGTPSGVGPIVPGDVIVGSVDGLPTVEMTLTTTTTK
jgi:fumarylpyruvate hydrolase